ncbi:hypothetical protein WJX82_007570 [Trebouxia sp. C0006]
MRQPSFKPRLSRRREHSARALILSSKGCLALESSLGGTEHVSCELLPQQHTWSSLTSRIQHVRQEHVQIAKVISGRKVKNDCGFSAALSKQLLDTHPTYVHWDLETELRPAVVAWQHDLGLQQMVKTSQAMPGLLIYPTSKLHELCAWLAFLGVQDAKKYVLSRTFLLETDLNTLQEKAAAVFA